MDPRKQKRLGPAPIASFEKSFEDNTASHYGNVSLQHIPKDATDSEVRDINRNGEKMEAHGNITRTTIKTTATITATTTTSSTEIHQQQQQQPSISVSQTATSGSTKTQNVVASINAISSSSNSNSSNNTSTITKPRPPPLKATTASGATTTLVSSGEQQVTFRGATTLTTPSTPRIELSRASSSSHHEEDSRESSPENVFEQVGTGTLQEALVLGFREDGALELRSSTEELYFMDAQQKKEEEEKITQQQQLQQQQQQQQPQPKRSSPLMFKFDEHQNYLQQHQRKDSASSEVAALLCISGRTSRISSVGSQGSALSRLSAVSGVSRSPSPHRMLLETSFCGPKPLENIIDGQVTHTVDPATVKMLEQLLLARKHDPTQAVLAEGIRVESSPKRTKPTTLSNGDPKLNAKIATQNRPNPIAASASSSRPPTMGRQRQSTKSPGQMVIGKTPSGTEYIRINLKPDHMYHDQGMAPNERMVEAPNTLAPVTSKSSSRKPASLSLGRQPMDETRLTPTASPKPTRRGKETKAGSRSPSPATVSVSRKSSFNSLFRVGVGKDSPDSPRERSRSRSKSKERPTSQTQSVTPSKQKSVLAIFKPNKRGSNAGADAKPISKSSSPIDGAYERQRSKSNTPLESGSGSRPASRLRYYDEPVEGYIHIPLHTPPEEQETRKLLQGIAQLTAEPRVVAAPVTASQLVAAAAALKPVSARKSSLSAAPRPQQIDKLQRIENLDAIHTLPNDDDNKERTWSLEVQRHSSQDSQETLGSDAGNKTSTARSSLANVREHPVSVQQNGVAAAAEIHRLPSEESNSGAGGVLTVKTLAMISSTGAADEEEVAREKRRLLFATRLGSGSQDQIFSTQFSISKTESQSSQLSEQQEVIPANAAAAESLQRRDTIIRRTENSREQTEVVVASKNVLQRFNSMEVETRTCTKAISTSDDDERDVARTTVTAAIVLRHKESKEELRRKSRSTSEEDAVDEGLTNQRHSRYLENFDVRRKYQEQLPRKPKRQSVADAAKEAMTVDEPPARTEPRQPILPQPPPPSTMPSPSPPPPPIAQITARSRSPTPTPTATRSQSQSPVERSSKQTPTKPPRTSTPTRRAATASPPSASESPLPTVKSAHPDRQSVLSTDEPIESSESERDSELASSCAAIESVDPKRHHLPRHVVNIEEHESTGLVSQESFDDELPYIPTTLPEERAQGIALIPMKERANMELKTCPVDRPRSTTPMNPSHLEEYCGIMAATPPEPPFVACGTAPVRGEKLRISLPRKDAASAKERTVQSSKSPRRASNAATGKSWFEFAEEGMRATGSSNLERKDSNKQLLPAVKTAELAAVAATPPAVSSSSEKRFITKVATTTTSASARKLSGHWIDFENIPEKRKPAKRITTLPRDGISSSSSVAATSTTARNQHTTPAPATANSHQHHHHHHQHGGSTQPDVTASACSSGDGKTHYNYVQPEDCQCECHEVERDSSGTTTGGSGAAAVTGANALTNVDLLQQGEDMLPLLDPDTHDGIEPSDSSREYSCYTDDEAEVPLRHSGTSRYQTKTDEFPRRDGSRSPRNRKFPDHRYS